ncbi:MAG TPA: NAD-dependent epimerase/dehydratase family protein [Coriobacteriia bacterium]|jgi:UDP-glucose 4-epimerase
MTRGRVLITGAAGMVGSNLVPLLLDRGWEVAGVDDLSMGSLANLAAVLGRPSFTMHQADVRDTDAYRSAARGADVVVHLAAKKIPKFGGAKGTLLANSHCAEVVLAEACRTGARVRLASTSDVYGMSPEPTLSEDGQLVMGPPTVKRWSYAISKLFDEQLALAYAEEDGLDVAVLRFFNSYGPRHHRSWWGGPQSVFIDAALGGGKLTVHGDGSQRRCFTYASDLVEGIALAVEAEDLTGEVLNIGNPREEVSIRQLAEEVCDLTGRDPQEAVEYVPHEGLFGRYQEVQRRVPDISRMRERFGYAPGVTLRDGLSRTIEWHREHPLDVPRAAS